MNMRSRAAIPLFTNFARLVFVVLGLTATTHGQVTKLPEPVEQAFPNGYEVVPQATASAEPVKQMPAGSAIIAAYIDVAGKRYFMTDWSFDRYQNGLTYNWVRPLGQAGSVKPTGGLTAQPAQRDGIVVSKLHHLTLSINLPKGWDAVTLIDDASLLKTEEYLRDGLEKVVFYSNRQIAGESYIWCMQRITDVSPDRTLTVEQVESKYLSDYLANGKITRVNLNFLGKPAHGVISERKSMGMVDQDGNEIIPEQRFLDYIIVLLEPVDGRFYEMHARIVPDPNSKDMNLEEFAACVILK